MSQIQSLVSQNNVSTTTDNQPASHPTASSGTLVTTCGRTLPLRATRLVVRSKGGLATVKLVQTFANSHQAPLHVRYQLPLPADAAVGGFAFAIGERRITGQIDRKAKARERFEQAIASGQTAALLEQDRSSLFSQELGNVPPGAEVTAEIEIDQPLVWQAGSWQWRFPTTVAPRFQGEPGRVADAAKQQIAVMADAIAPRLQLELLVRDELASGMPTSPSHALQCAQNLDGTAVQIAGAPMDRDVVVMWPVAAQQPGVTVDFARPPADAPHGSLAYGLLTLVPPQIVAQAPRMPRDLIVLLDISGSMSGHPLAAAQRVVGELIQSLDEGDRLELVAFSSRRTAWLGAPCFATAHNKAAAQKWLMSLRAGGGTQMRDAILGSLQPLRESAQRQIVLVTDGLIGFEEEIVGEIRNRLPSWSRVHVVGVGSAPNRSLTRCAARAGRGLEVLIGLSEDAGPAAQKLLTRTSMPLVTNLQISGSAVASVCPEAAPDLFAGAPARLALELRPEGGTLEVRGFTSQGGFAHTLQVPPIAASSGDSAITRLVGRERIEDLETALAAAGGDRAELTAQIEQLGLSFALASRATSWIAIDQQATVDPSAPRQSVEVPHELPFGMSIDGLGLRPAMASNRMRSGPAAPMASVMAAVVPEEGLLDDDAFGGEFEELADECIDVEPPAAAPTPRKEELAPTQMPVKAKKAAPRRRGVGDRGQSPTGAAQPGTPQPQRAVLRVRNDKEFVFDLFALPGWTACKTVRLTFADGREFTLLVLLDRSTPSGAVPADSPVRLVLAAIADLPSDAPVSITLGDDKTAPTLPIA